MVQGDTLTIGGMSKNEKGIQSKMIKHDDAMDSRFMYRVVGDALGVS